MPIRTTVLATGEVYHVFNRSIDRQPIFLSSRACRRAKAVMNYYSYVQPPIRFSKFLQLSKDRQQAIMDSLKGGKKLITFIAYCYMPNHYHFLVKQEVDNGISKFLANFQNSFARYLNTQAERKGPVWQSQFKAVRIENEGQLLHVSRYIHLNPYTSFVVKELKMLDKYPWSSVNEYLTSSCPGICNTELVLSCFKKPSEYEKFVRDGADYQRTLEGIKHLTFE